MQNLRTKEGKEGLCHAGIDLLLPWYLNHTLEKGEQEEVAKHLPGCAICQRELEVLSKEKKLYQSLAEEIFVPKTFPQLMAKIEGSKETLWQRIISVIPIPLPRPTFATVLIALQSCIIVGLIVFLAINPWRAGERAYRTLSGPTVIEEKGPRLVILFQEGVLEKIMRGVILEIDGSIVSGPSSIGLYIVELRSKIDPEELHHALSLLQQKKDVIRFVELEGS